MHSRGRRAVATEAHPWAGDRHQHWEGAQTLVQKTTVEPREYFSYPELHASPSCHSTTPQQLQGERTQPIQRVHVTAGRLQAWQVRCHRVKGFAPIAAFPRQAVDHHARHHQHHRVKADEQLQQRQPSRCLGCSAQRCTAHARNSRRCHDRGGQGAHLAELQHPQHCKLVPATRPPLTFRDASHSIHPDAGAAACGGKAVAT